ncbi:FAD-dependent oxidoreductase [Crassaminicella thermophila]|uniref:FAD-dependent oxidoreductase n=1 Tax=Crassaminicella thermophila TaxID=2599308 RepID=A0A5C0SG99_CRATE|nr:NAD(P)/FAD-dependent oxidoreductase [Crassaminicella thermophila]QEK12414.1 FAD-dependent oxidoreductase [Crassaminicella thermophila]
MKYDVIVVGAGPSGIFTALELIRQKSSKKVLIIEKGRSIEKRHCPKEETEVCVSCKPYCHITTGFSGAGAFSDGKLSLSYEVGGELPSLIGSSKAQDLINYTDKIYLEFGADPKVEGLENNDAIKEIRRKAIEAGLKLVDCPIRHLGTEKAQEIYFKIQNYLIKSGVEIKFNTVVKDIVIEEGVAKGVKIANSQTKENEEILYGNKIIIATGRKGADWLKDMCVKHGINHSAGTVDIGVRVEVRNEIMEKVNNVLYESKLIGYPEPFRNKVRTFCQNPGGFVSQENYDNDLAIVNGHSYKDKKSENTNLAILSSHNFSQPFNQPIQYGKKVAELVNMLGNGKILVQRYGDILDGKRTWQHELDQSNVKPTLPDAIAGDVTSAIPYRPMMNILNFIKAMNTVVPGFASRETLLYGPEIKFYSNKINLDQNFETNIKRLHCLGDSSGWTRGLMMASVMGVLMGQMIAEEK